MNDRRGYTAHSFKNIHVEVDEKAPSGMLYFLNDNYQQFYSIDARSRWQRFKDWVLRLVGRRKR